MKATRPYLLALQTIRNIKTSVNKTNTYQKTKLVLYTIEYYYDTTHINTYTNISIRKLVLLLKPMC